MPYRPETEITAVFSAYSGSSSGLYGVTTTGEVTLLLDRIEDYDSLGLDPGVFYTEQPHFQTVDDDLYFISGYSEPAENDRGFADTTIISRLTGEGAFEDVGRVPNYTPAARGLGDHTEAYEGSYVLPLYTVIGNQSYEDLFQVAPDGTIDRITDFGRGNAGPRGDLVTYEGEMYLVADQRTPLGGFNHELWRIDPEGEDSFIFEDTRDGVMAAAVFNGALYFATRGITGKLWRIEGEGSPEDVPLDTIYFRPKTLHVVEDQFYAVSWDGIHVLDDGRLSGDLAAGGGRQAIRESVVFQDQLYFTADIGGDRLLFRMEGDERVAVAGAGPEVEFTTGPLVADDGRLYVTVEREVSDGFGGVSGVAAALASITPDGTVQMLTDETFDRVVDIHDFNVILPGRDIGGQGQDVLEGQDGRDVLEGVRGDDVLRGFGGDDTLDGGIGADTLNSGDGDDTIIGGPDGHEADQRDVIYAGAGDDLAEGGGGNDQIFGQEDNDTLSGGFGSDELQGQEGNDVITGGALSDLVFGGSGDDFVNGGFGYDRINGGAGADRLFHLGVFDHGSDWIQDYNALEGDVLVFGNAGATEDQFQVNFAHTATPAGDRSGDNAVQEAFVIYRPTGQIMWALVDGAGQSGINLQIGSEVFDLLA